MTTLPHLPDPVLPIVQLGDPVLRQRAAQIDVAALSADQREQLTQLAAVMVSTMLDAPGVGVAAPQVGVSLQLAVMQDLWPVDPAVSQIREREPMELKVVLNPTYSPLDNITSSFYEGCLSMRGYTAVVDRPRSILARWTELDGTQREEELHGWQARIFQHETDHLAGILYIDKALTRSLSTDENYALRWAEPAADRARKVLGF